MKVPRWVWWTLLIASPVLLIAGSYVLGFLSEPSAVGRMRAALYVIGAGSILLGLVSGVASVWMLVRHRT